MMMLGDGPSSEGGMDGSGDTQAEDVVSAEHPLNERQCAMEEAIDAIVETFGQFEQDSNANGAHYMPESPFAAQGIACSSCAFYDGMRMCEAVKEIGRAHV